MKLFPKILQNLKKEVNLNFFAVHLVEHCNLNCEGCDHCSPLAEAKFADIDQFSKDLSRLSKLFDNVKSIGLMGGEPLLHPNLTDFFDKAREIFPKTFLVLFTNGILLDEKDDKFWDSCLKNDIIINVTKYPVDINFEKMEQFAKQKKVKFCFYNHPLEVRKTSHKIVFDLEGKQNINESFENCSHKTQGCRFLKDGCLYPCTVAPNSTNFSKYFKKDMPLSEDDCVNIHNAKSGKQILKLLSKPIPFCRYCNVKARTTNIPWDFSKKDINEWT